MPEQKKTPSLPNTGNEEIPPGATTRAADRPTNGGGPPGSGGGSRHAADDPGSPNEEYGAVDSNDPRADGPPVGQDAPLEEEARGTPAQKRGGGKSR